MLAQPGEDPRPDHPSTALPPPVVLPLTPRRLSHRRLPAPICYPSPTLIACAPSRSYSLHHHASHNSELARSVAREEEVVMLLVLAVVVMPRLPVHLYIGRTCNCQGSDFTIMPNCPWLGVHMHDARSGRCPFQRWQFLALVY